VELVDGKVEGIAVHIGARIAAEARPGEVLVSSIVRDLAAGSGIDFEDRGVPKLSGFRESGACSRLASASARNRLEP
jgi:class 3 adenylate cyclase